METEVDYRVKLKSKKLVVDQLQKYRALIKKLLNEQATINEEVKQQMLQELLRDFDKGVQENILINGESWEDAPNDTVDEENCKTLDDLLDENILETSLKRSSYPKKILPYVVRSLKAERALMGLYKQTVKPQQMTKDPVQETIMNNLSEAAPRIIKQASEVIKSLQALQQRAAGVCQVLGMQPTPESMEVHREVFGMSDIYEMPPILGDVARSSQPLKKAVMEMELSSAYALPIKRLLTASKREESE
ncbi:hypothetical protein AGOR_G00084350 [Albula goreensis]|uniref:Uncharacterized protein n=1 Tax=Albula goreensis TaxID=1534307 RepID=A0A8T3DJW5_9TELE|nr:hypothetical protein AGOR_G00084350 [Albula goreensis]